MSYTEAFSPPAPGSGDKYTKLAVAGAEDIRRRYGHPPMHRNSGVNGHVSVVDGVQEPIIVDDADHRNKPTYDSFYNSFLDDQASRLFKDGTDQLHDVKKVVKAAYKYVFSEIAYNKDYADSIPKYKAYDIAEAITNGKGVCRHQGALAAYLLERLQKEFPEQLQGSVHYHRSMNETQDKGHAWAGFQEPDGNLYIIDPAQRFHGTLERARFTRPLAYAWFYSQLYRKGGFEVVEHDRKRDLGLYALDAILTNATRRLLTPRGLVVAGSLAITGGLLFGSALKGDDTEAITAPREPDQSGLISTYFAGGGAKQLDLELNGVPIFQDNTFEGDPMTVGKVVDSIYVIGKGLMMLCPDDGRRAEAKHVRDLTAKDLCWTPAGAAVIEAPVLPDTLDDQDIFSGYATS